MKVKGILEKRFRTVVPVYGRQNKAMASKTRRQTLLRLAGEQPGSQPDRISLVSNEANANW